MTVRLALIMAATALASAGALAQGKAPPAKAVAAAPAPPPELKALVESCNARKFEATVEATVNGAKHSRRIRLCGREGQSDASWIATLRDAATKTEANAALPKPMRDAIVSAIKLEIARVEASRTAPVAVAVPAPQAPRALTPPAARLPEYSALPPLPAPLPPAAKTTPASVTAATPKPRLTIGCVGRSEAGACRDLERGTVLTVLADDDLGGGATLRFLRRGSVRGEVSLDPLRKDQAVRVRLPASLCAGVASSKVEIQILGSGSGRPVLATAGPYMLRC